MKSGKGEVSRLLHKRFTNSAIESAALGEMLEDTKYLEQNNILYDDEKQKEMYDKSLMLSKKDDRKTLNKKNISEFHTLMDSLLNEKKIKNMYEGLTDIEHYAVRALYHSVN